MKYKLHTSIFKCYYEQRTINVWFKVTTHWSCEGTGQNNIQRQGFLETIYFKLARIDLSSTPFSIKSCGASFAVEALVYCTHASFDEVSPYLLFNSSFSHCAEHLLLKTCLETRGTVLRILHRIEYEVFVNWKFKMQISVGN